MKVTCGWCDKHMETVGAATDSTVSHGICPTCAEQHFGDVLTEAQPSPRRGDSSAFAWLLSLGAMLVALAAGCVEPVLAQRIQRNTVARATSTTCHVTRSWTDPVNVDPVTRRPLVWLATYRKPGDGPCADRPTIPFVPGHRSTARVEWEVR